MKDTQLDEEKVFVRLVKVIEVLLQTYRAKDLREKPQINNETDLFVDLQIDSLEIMDLIGAIETEFKISVKPEDLALKRKVKDIVELLLRG